MRRKAGLTLDFSPEYEKAYETHETPYYDYTHTLTNSVDGDGQLVKRHSEMSRVNGFGSSGEEDFSYYVRSSVLGGQILTEINEEGDKIKTSVFVGGAEIAEQRPGSTDEIVWKHVDEITGSRNSIKADGNQFWGGANDSDFNAEVEPVGMADIPTIDPYDGPGDPENAPMPTRFKLGGDVFNVSKCFVNFHHGPIECSQLKDLASSWGMTTLGGYIWIKQTLQTGVRDPESEAGFKTEDSFAWDLMELPELSSIRNDNLSKCDTRLARIFGGDDAVMATKWDIMAIRPATRDLPERRNTTLFDRENGTNPVPGSEDPRAGTVHLYPNADGTAGSGSPNGYTPPGWKSVVSDISGTGNFFRFYYAPKSLSKYGYDGGLTINFTHIGPTDAKGVAFLPKPNGPTNQMGSVQVGVLGGGPGSNTDLTKGSTDYYVHSHMIFNKWDGKTSPINDLTRIDPRAVFCSDLGFKESKIQGTRPR